MVSGLQAAHGNSGKGSLKEFSPANSGGSVGAGGRSSGSGLVGRAQVSAASDDDALPEAWKVGLRRRKLIVTFSDLLMED